MKKILVLAMSCQLPEYKEKEKIFTETIGSQIDKAKNAEWFFFNSSKDKYYYIHYDDHVIEVPVIDRKETTFQKLAKTLVLIDTFDYDYIVRVNLSTFFDFNKVRTIIENIEDDREMLAGTLFNQPWVAHHAPFLSGEILILSRKNIDILKNYYLENRKMFNSLEMNPSYNDKGIADDGWITIIFNEYYKEKYLDLIHSIGIVYECYGNELKYQNLYNTFPAVCCKTVSGSENLEKTTQEKYKQVSEIYSKIQSDEFSLDNWKANVLDKHCFNVIEDEKSDKIDFFHKHKTKQEVIDYWKNEIIRRL